MSFKLDQDDANVFFYRLLDPLYPFELDCKTNLDPTIKIKWFKDDKEIVKDEIEGIEVTQQKLVVLRPDLKAHQGYYHCEAENKKGLAKSEVIRFR